MTVNDVNQIPKQHTSTVKKKWTNPNLGGTNKLKILLNPQKENDKLRLQTTIHSIKHSKDLITDLEHKHSTQKPSRRISNTHK